MTKTSAREGARLSNDQMREMLKAAGLPLMIHRPEQLVGSAFRFDCDAFESELDPGKTLSLSVFGTVVGVTCVMLEDEEAAEPEFGLHVYVSVSLFYLGEMRLLRFISKPDGSGAWSAQVDGRLEGVRRTRARVESGVDEMPGAFSLINPFG